MADLASQVAEMSEELVGRGEIPAGMRSPLLGERGAAGSRVLAPPGWHSRQGEGIEDWSDGTVFRTAPSYAGSLKRLCRTAANCGSSRNASALFRSRRRAWPNCFTTMATLLRGARADRLPERGSIVAVHCQLGAGCMRRMPT